MFGQAFAAGELTERHVRELHKLDNHRVHHQLVESQDLLVAAAKDCDFSDFVNVLAYWLNAATPTDANPPRRWPRRCVATGNIPTGR